MLKKLNKYETQHILNVRKVEKMIDRQFYKACVDAAFLTYGIDARLSDDALFTFADYPYLTRRLNKILDTLKNRTFMTVVSGIKASWDLSKTKNDNLVHSLFGEGLDAARFNRYYSTRTGAVNAFIKRVDNGLSLSDKVWKYTERFKNEIELGIDCGLRDGLSAPEIARSLKMYLQYPDKLFRRVRTQHGILKLSKTAAAFHPGQGVYRSSYKNARRLAATETNIAYRTADFERWQDFDFVVGIEIKLSNNHTLNGKPFTDICDKLKGKYPKDFKFVGWHPLCRCHALSILKTPKEIAEDMKRERQGLPPISLEDSTNAITSLPDNFNNWVRANGDRIQKAEKRRTAPYFLKDNRELWLNTYQNDRINKLLDNNVPPIVHTAQEVLEADPISFKKAIAREKAMNKNGWMVDVHDDYRGIKCFLTEDGKAGVAVTKDGDIVSLFSSVKGDHRSEKLIMMAIENGGCKCDCYGGGLENIYARFGAKAVGKVKFNEEYAPTDWKLLPDDDLRKQKYDVVAMIFPKTVRESVKLWDKDAVIDLSTIRLFDDYEDMLKFRDSLL